MKRKVNIYSTGHAFLGKNVPDDGYKGEVDAIFNAVTITIIKPNTTLEDVIRSLEITIEDIKLRIKQPDNVKGN